MANHESFLFFGVFFCFLFCLFFRDKNTNLFATEGFWKKIKSSQHFLMQLIYAWRWFKSFIYKLRYLILPKTYLTDSQKKKTDTKTESYLTLKKKQTQVEDRKLISQTKLPTWLNFNIRTLYSSSYFRGWTAII